MSKDTDLKKHTLFLFDGDYATLQSYYADVGAAVIIRKIVRAYVLHLEKNVANAGDIDIKVNL